MRKSKELKEEIDKIENSQMKLFSEILLDIRNTLIQLHIGKVDK